MLKAPRGTFDILPPQSHKWAFLENKLRDVSKKYNFEEIRTPTFEHSELFARSVGETTDIVEKEMYTFKDKAGRDLALRPEGTASVARAFIEHGMAQGPLPRKFFYIGSMFRYEKPQAGRYREFAQYGAEILGSASPYSDVEVIMLAVSIAENLGLTGTKLLINTIGCPACRAKYRQDLISYLSQQRSNLCEDCQKRLMRNPLRVLDCKNPSCRKVTEGLPSMLEYLCNECERHWVKFREILSSVDIEYEVDKSLVRGLDYYTKTVFELVWPPLGAQNALLGGGRYDGLIEQLGGKPTPGVGFAMGMERILSASEKGERPIRPVEELDFFVVTQKSGNEDIPQRGFLLVSKLRALGLSCDFDPLDRSLKSQMKHADRLNARFVAILGEEELKKNVVSIKSMKEGWQKEVALDAIDTFVQEEVCHANY